MGVVLPANDHTFFQQSEELWIQAKKTVENTIYQNRVEKSELSFRFLKLCYYYNSEYTQGSEIQRKEYEQRNQQLLNDLLKHRVYLGEGTPSPVFYRSDLPPHAWSRI